jgi:hypothetical protein
VENRDHCNPGNMPDEGNPILKLRKHWNLIIAMLSTNMLFNIEPPTTLVFACRA